MEKLLSPAQVCEIVPGLNVHSLAQMRYLGTGPKFIKPTPRKVVYRLSDVEAWLQANEHTSTRATA